MQGWKKIKIDGIAKIEKCVAEFNIMELYKSPYGFRIKIYEDAEGSYTGYTNILVKDESDEYSCTVGFGKTIDKALEETIHYYMEKLSIKEIWLEEDFRYLDSSEF